MDDLVVDAVVLPSVVVDAAAPMNWLDDGRTVIVFQSTEIILSSVSRVEALWYRSLVCLFETG